MRLISSVNEYYRQKSPTTEQMVKKGLIDKVMRIQYYNELPKKHNELDPRYIHSVPIHRFTHYGKRAMVDRVIRCESLYTDFINIATEYKLPDEMKKYADKYLNDDKGRTYKHKLDDYEISLANNLYREDFKTFDYPMKERINKKVKYINADEDEDIHNADGVTWHWGPMAIRPHTSLKATRTKKRGVKK